jgi:hypothetical protein
MNSNTEIIEDVLNNEEIELLLNNEIVKTNKQLLDIHDNKEKTIKFNVVLNEHMIDKLNTRLKCNLSYNSDIPFRWIKGNTPAHIDKDYEGNQSNTHLVYLTDNSGKLLIDNKEYPIRKGCGYIFDEGLEHETIDTEHSVKLILGPFNYKGDALGIVTAILTDLQITPGTLTPSFNSSIYNYTVIVDNSTTTVIITLATNGFSINGGSICIASNSATLSLPISVGTTNVSFTPSADGTCTNPGPTYTIIITRSPPPPPPAPTISMRRIVGSIYSDNSLVYYKPHSLPSCGVGTVKNSRHVARKT